MSIQDSLSILPYAPRPNDLLIPMTAVRAVVDQIGDGPFKMLLTAREGYLREVLSEWLMTGDVSVSCIYFTPAVQDYIDNWFRSIIPDIAYRFASQQGKFTVLPMTSYSWTYVRNGNKFYGTFREDV